jgi:uncharacterized protein YgiM (DUF1202 family)
MLQEKYKDLIAVAQQAGLQVVESAGVLRIDGEAASAGVKDQLWNTYDRLDPNFLSGDVVLNVKVATAVNGGKVKVVTASSNLNIRKGPGTDQPIVGKAAHEEVITLVNKSNDQWWLVRTNDGEEGYAYAQYLSPVE